jgi:hypothetical protein
MGLCAFYETKNTILTFTVMRQSEAAVDNKIAVRYLVKQTMSTPVSHLKYAG